jgi:hypothetical protein
VMSQFEIKIKPRRHSDTKLHGDNLCVLCHLSVSVVKKQTETLSKFCLAVDHLAGATFPAKSIPLRLVIVKYTRAVPLSKKVKLMD